MLCNFPIIQAQQDVKVSFFGRKCALVFNTALQSEVHHLIVTLSTNNTQQKVQNSCNKFIFKFIQVV